MQDEYGKKLFEQIDIEKIHEVSRKISENHSQVVLLIESLQREDVNHAGISKVIQEKIQESLELSKEYSSQWSKADFDLEAYKKYISEGNKDA